MARKYNDDVVDAMIEGLKKVPRREYISNDYAKEMRKMGAKMYKIGVRLTTPGKIFLDDNVREAWKPLIYYLKGLNQVSLNKEKVDHPEKVKNGLYQFNSGIYMMAYGYQLGIQAERERRTAKQAKEKAAKHGNA